MGFNYRSWISLPPGITISTYTQASSEKEPCVPKMANSLSSHLICRDGSLICRGKGNDDWLQSAPHGAGRLMSRSAAKKQLSMEEYRQQMHDIYSTSVCESTIDEAPMAYKSAEEIEELIGDTVDVVKRIKPIYNFKAK